MDEMAEEPKITLEITSEDFTKMRALANAFRDEFTSSLPRYFFQRMNPKGNKRRRSQRKRRSDRRNSKGE
jgi:hypothetical protein